MSSSRCGGCNKHFNSGFFLQHIRKTTNPACQAYGKQLQSASGTGPDTAALLGSLLNQAGAMSAEEQQQMGAPMEVDLQGDYFGAYDDLDNDVDIGDLVQNRTDLPSGARFGDEDSGSDMDSGLESDENGWEPEADRPNESRSPSPELVFPEGYLDAPETLQLPRSRPPPLSHPDTTREPHIVHYPDPRAGAPLSSQTDVIDARNIYRDQLGQRSNKWAPFQSEIDWKITKWAKMRGPSSTAFSELLAINGVCEKLDLSYRNSNELNAIIDKKLPSSHPQFQRQEVVVQGQVFELYFQDILECVKALYSDAEFAPYLKLAPERHFEDASCSEQLYHNMHTGSWWWSTQSAIDKNAGPGRTVIPIIISSDKTQVTVFHNKTAYPVYLTIGNIPKEIRRKPSKHAYVLLGYLPSTNLEHIKNAASRRRSIANLFHTCMRYIVKPLEDVGATGVVMTSGDGVDRLAHPIFTAYIGDYPEQILVTCCITGYCPRCTIPRQRVGENTEPHPLRNLRSILEALQMVDQGGAAFIKACRDAGIKPVFEPFWANLPYSNVFLSITPDILHQLYQGVFKHLKAWVIEAYGAHEIDARCRCLPPNHNIRLFMKGISTLQRVSGQEHGQISHFILGLIADAPLPNGMSPVRLLKCLRGLLNFLFIAQFPVHSTTTLQLLSDSLNRFHNNKQIFIDLNIQNNFHIPKIHFLNHYVETVKQLGTFDNFNTEYTERLHIDMAKDAYRSTNRKDEYSQMTRWLEQKEKMMKHESYIDWLHSGEHPPLRMHWIPPGLNTARSLKMAKHPSVYTVKIPELAAKYGAEFFHAALSRYVVQLKNPRLVGRQLEDAVDSLFLGVSHVSVYHRVKFLRHDFFMGVSSTADSIHAQPGRRDKYGHPVNGRFDTALVHITDSQGPIKVMTDTRVAQVRVVFTLSDKVADSLYQGVPEHDRAQYLAYVEWFSPFTQPDENHGLFKVSRCNVEGGRLASVVDVQRLVRSVHLFPKFGPVADQEWTSSTVLDTCSSFFVNAGSDRHMYQLFLA
ncbi:hypothetical protein VKT23_008195 [Stygiomarasmius scandens]|uniref:Transposase n=1 Tax=Marasmiellus scandens TaxID=2682957 RepID=A0ABR1JM68_9AGAR